VTPEEDPGSLVALWDWRRRVTDLYGEVRATSDPVAAWRRWREVRDQLYATHPQSPIPPGERASFAGLSYFAYDPAYRVLADVVEEPGTETSVGGSAGPTFAFTRFATASFELFGGERTFGLYWLEGYAGGTFLCFRDATSGSETYGAGRYLLDTAKGADLGRDGDGRLVLDLNFAYQPSCSYDPRWACPLAPPENRLDVAVEAGERQASEEK
jgi:uncharacterized protein (DUF1684 family)